MNIWKHGIFTATLKGLTLRKTEISDCPRRINGSKGRILFLILRYSHVCILMEINRTERDKLMILG